MIENSQLTSLKIYKLSIANYKLMLTFAHLFD